MVAEFDRRGLYESWECRGTPQWLTWKCGVAARTAREHVHVARALEKLPLATAAFARGELSYAKVRAMARVVGRGARGAVDGHGHHGHRGAVGADPGDLRPSPPQEPDEVSAEAAGDAGWWDDEATMLEFKGLLCPRTGRC